MLVLELWRQFLVFVSVYKSLAVISTVQLRRMTLWLDHCAEPSVYPLSYHQLTIHCQHLDPPTNPFMPTLPKRSSPVQSAYIPREHGNHPLTRSVFRLLVPIPP